MTYAQKLAAEIWFEENGYGDDMFKYIKRFFRGRESRYQEVGYSCNVLIKCQREGDRETIFSFMTRLGFVVTDYEVGDAELYPDDVLEIALPTL